ncbi:hypothetical protein SARC_09152 [Sphaeroforma arctica JP610]|uniref:Uncharacterized protein n=1 Tax=Sphaeroforma arctica JP610 TaxID=667725 RepID=A0A0L0FQY1_9EUKA|nr:hypothetical protein SARC_09152 [Sphaeroforma arctica JP610]KNC78418.1 hypothetical protein SARC_09152 [Sphaeroforma arctica JP610]|eukprot:XP_014152320.1 hypothetical protein SARC_09152 [Sphaeroforma arctica JP610]
MTYDEFHANSGHLSRMATLRLAKRHNIALTYPPKPSVQTNAWQLNPTEWRPALLKVIHIFDTTRAQTVPASILIGVTSISFLNLHIPILSGRTSTKLLTISRR